MNESNSINRLYLTRTSWEKWDYRGTNEIFRIIDPKLDDERRKAFLDGLPCLHLIYVNEDEDYRPQPSK